MLVAVGTIDGNSPVAVRISTVVAICGSAWQTQPPPRSFATAARAASTKFGVVRIVGYVSVNDGLVYGVGRLHVRLRWENDISVRIRLQLGHDRCGRGVVDPDIVVREPVPAVLANDGLDVVRK